MRLGWRDVIEAVSPWSFLGVAVLGASAVSVGVFDPGYPLPAFTISVAAALLALIGVDLYRRRGQRERFFAALEGPALWIVSLWALSRLSPSYGPHLGALGLIALLALRLRRPPIVWGAAALLILAMELALAASGRQPWGVLGLRLLLLGAALLIARRVFPLPRPTLEEIKDEAAPEGGWAARMNLLTEQHRRVPALVPGDPQPQVQTVRLSESFNLLLEILSGALGLSSAVVLWRDRGRLHIFSQATTCGPLREGPFSEDTGALRYALSEAREIAICPASRGDVPYYTHRQEVGAVFAVAIETAGSVGGVLCVDRASARPWSEAERTALRRTAEKLSADLAFTQRFKATKHELSLIERFSRGLQKLNQTLELREAAEAALEAVQLLVQIDLAVISLLEDAKQGFHRVLLAVGEDAPRFMNLTFTEDEGLVGQAVAARRTRPAPGELLDAQAIFTSADRLPRMRSLLIMPLLDADGEPLGALTVASVRPRVCDQPPHREMLELIASQAAVRIDLARAHEQIKEMATVDGLTGLLNHRTFQQAFDKMLIRAKRNERPLSIILTDIDHFKRFNDTYGHPFGDIVLSRVAKVLRQAVRKLDVAARYGGEEFVIILEDAEEEGAASRAEHVRQQVEALVFEHDIGPVSVTLSLGVASFPLDGTLKSDLIDRADKALYRAKHGGRNQVRLWSSVAAEVAGQGET
ncbi:diguanylate cyclase [Myxococcota bacterium]|nr:diguanylate cyclase [Myxococcota bacterium]MBU1898457.1 diguanylate cyclase [Myxococcota bacterium]